MGQKRIKPVQIMSAQVFSSSINCINHAKQHTINWYTNSC